MKSHNLCLRLNDFSSVAEAVSKRNNGLKEWAREMNYRVSEANTTEEIYRIIDDYVEII